MQNKTLRYTWARDVCCEM